MIRHDDDYIRHEIKEITFYVILGIVMAIIVPIAAGFGFDQFKESFVEGRALVFGDQLVRYVVYYVLILGALIGLPTLKVREIILTNPKEHPAEQSKPALFAVALIHDPEQDGLLYNLFSAFGLKGDRNPMRWSRSVLRNFLLAFVLFGFVGIFQALTKYSFVDIHELFTHGSTLSRVILSMEPPSFAETNLMLFVFCIFLGFNAWVCSKTKLGKLGYFALGIFACLLTAFLWMGFHHIVYGNDEASLFATFAFGFFGSFITLLMGTIIYWYTWHLVNNGLVELKKIGVANEDVIFLVGLTIFLVLVLWISGEVLLKKFRKREPYYPPEPQTSTFK